MNFSFCRCTPSVSVLSQINLLYATLPYNLILSSHLRLGTSKLSLSLMFPNQNPIFPLSSSPYRLDALQVTFLPILSPCQFWWRIQIIKFLILQFSTFPYKLVPLRHKYPPPNPNLNNLKLLQQCERPSFKPTQKIPIIILLCISIFKCLVSKL